MSVRQEERRGGETVEEGQRGEEGGGGSGDAVSRGRTKGRRFRGYAKCVGRDTAEKEDDGEVADGCSRPAGEEVGSRSG